MSHETELEHLQRLKCEMLRAEIRELSLKLIPPTFELRVERRQGITGQLDEKTIVMDLKMDGSEYLRFLQLMKHFTSDEYREFLAECKDLSESSKYLIEKEMGFFERVDAYKASLIDAALKKTGGNKKAAAALLGMKRTTLHELAKSLGVEKPSIDESIDWNIRRASKLIEKIKEEEEREDEKEITEVKIVA